MSLLWVHGLASWRALKMSLYRTIGAAESTYAVRTLDVVNPEPLRSRPPKHEATHWWADPTLYAAFQSLTHGRGRPVPGVLDTSCVRTGLAKQLENGVLPPSMGAVLDGTIRLFMERDTLTETYRKLPKFAEQLGVSTSVLVRMFKSDWLPHIRIVSLPPGYRDIDPRATEVRDLDADDYPAAALAALLAPCVLLTHDYKHFCPLGITSYSQGVDAVFAAVDIRFHESRLQIVVSAPAMPFVAVSEGVKWTNERIGSAGWVILGVLLIGAIVVYQRQSTERKAAIRKVAGDGTRWFLEESRQAAISVQNSHDMLDTYLVPAPPRQTPTAAVFREIATACDSMSAQQLADILDVSVRPRVDSLRMFLHANKLTVFTGTRRGSFMLGKHVCE